MRKNTIRLFVPPVFNSIFKSSVSNVYCTVEEERASLVVFTCFNEFGKFNDLHFFTSLYCKLGVSYTYDVYKENRIVFYSLEEGSSAPSLRDLHKRLTFSLNTNKMHIKKYFPHCNYRKRRIKGAQYVD